jgi:plasmid stabilization system protein ParE
VSRYVLSAQARLDLLQIWNRIAEQNIDAADTVKEELRRAMNQLVSQPGMGHRRKDVRNPRYRFWTVYSYLIAYHPDTVPLQIVRVVHGARDINRLFKER